MIEWPETAIEVRMGIAPLEMLQSERLALVERSADLAAKYGPWGTWDATRKSVLSGIKAAIRARAARDKVRKSDKQLDDESHADADYLEFIATSTMERAEWIKVDRRINDITERCNRGQVLGRFATAELGLK